MQEVVDGLVLGADGQGPGELVHFDKAARGPVSFFHLAATFSISQVSSDVFKPLSHYHSFGRQNKRNVL